MYENKIMIIIMLFGLVGCAGMTWDRTFVDEMDNQPEEMFSPGDHFPVVAGDSGKVRRSRGEIMARTPLTPIQDVNKMRQASLQSELDAKLEGLSDAEYDQYLRYRSYLNTDSEKIYFLSLPEHEKMSYLESKRVQVLPVDGGRGPASITNFYRVEDKEIYLGMPKEEVSDLWGRPHRVDVAGNPRHENERWSFYRNGKVKTIYFEAGRVQGWAMD